LFVLILFFHIFYSKSHDISDDLLINSRITVGFSDTILAIVYLRMCVQWFQQARIQKVRLGARVWWGKGFEAPSPRRRRRQGGEEWEWVSPSQPTRESSGAS